MRILIFIIGFVLTPTLAGANVKPHALCSEGMVLQQRSSAKIWGAAAKGEKVSVSFRGKTAAAVTDDDGRWVVAVDSGEAGGPFELTIAGNNSITYKNVLVGEVWLCSGQSNMELAINSSDQGDKEIAKSAPPNPMLRMFTVKRIPHSTPQFDTGGAWTDARPQTVSGFSAVAYFFGRDLNENLKVPVGLIHASWGGTRIETWMSQTAIDPFDKARPIVKFNSPNGLSQLYNGMIHPLLHYRVKGAIWYQGESNGVNAGGYHYRALHPALIESWRHEFSNPDLAFYFVQIAPYSAVKKVPGESKWAELREAQTMTLKLKNTGMAVTTDWGDEADIHPVPKRPIGIRLALAARAQTYGEKIVHSGPMYKSVQFDGNKATLTFDHVGGGLVGKEMVATPSNIKTNKNAFAWRVQTDAPDTPMVVGFTMCGKDKVFHAAAAEIVGDTVVVTCPVVVEPIAVRYGWADHPICGLFNREGLPASPFRTDEFPGITQPKK